VEPTLVAAVVSAAGALLEKALEVFAGARDPKAQEQLAGVIHGIYPPLKVNLTPGCLRVLRSLEAGGLMYPWMLRERFYPKLQLPQEQLKELDREFRYRLEYLRLHGVVALIAGGEYGISRLGLAFLEEARRRRDYPSELLAS
jgi:hypothetical protein